MAILNAIVADPIDQVSDHRLIQVRMEAILVVRGPNTQLEPEEIDPRTLPQTTIRKVIKECLYKVVFDSTPEINRRSLVDVVPGEIAKNYKPKVKQGHQTIRYSPARRSHTRHQSYSNSQGNSTTTRFWTPFRGTSEREI